MIRKKTKFLPGGPTRLQLLKLPKKIRTNVRNLFHEDHAVRCLAADRLIGNWHEKANPFLIKLLDKDPYPLVRQYAAIALGQPKNNEAIPHLAESLRMDMKWVAFGSAHALGQIGGNEVIPLLISALEHKQNEVRECAIQELGENAHADSIPPLLAINSKYGKVHDEAVHEAMEKIRRKMFEQKPKPSLTDPHLAFELIDYKTHPNSFITLWNELREGRVKHLKKTSLDTYVRQLKGLEPSLKT